MKTGRILRELENIKKKQKIHIMGIPEEKEKNDKKVYLKQND